MWKVEDYVTIVNGQINIIIVFRKEWSEIDKSTIRRQLSSDSLNYHLTISSPIK